MSFEVGELVVDEQGHRGNVRFVGPVKHAKKADQVWIGVEWAAKGRGKHDGSAPDKDGQVVRYFECAQGQGSFVKPKSLRKGSSFKDAVIARYQPEHGDSAQAEEGEFGPRRATTGQAVAIEAVGMGRIREKQQLGMLREVSLSECAVAWAGEPGWIRENVPNVRELDLSTNLFESWEEIGSIIQQLPLLTHLNLGNNKLKEGLPVNPIEKLPAALKQPFASIKTLVLPKTTTTLAKVQRLETEGVFPCLEELILGNNDLASLDPLADVKSEVVSHQKGSYAEWAKEQIAAVDRKGFTPESFAKGFRCLVYIDISRNNISSWSEVWRLSRLPCVRVLNASDNPIESIFFDGAVPTAGEQLGSSSSSSNNNNNQQGEGAEEDGDATNEEPLPVGQGSAEDAEDIKDVQEERRREAAKFARLIENPEEAAKLADEEKHMIKGQPGLDIVMSNGMRIPISQKKERARYTDSRCWKGDGTGGGAFPFASLTNLQISRTRVADWESINALQLFPALEELRILGSPVVASASNAGAARQNIIARVQGLRRLNGSEVNLRERVDAEMLYLKRVALARQACASEEEQAKLLAEHPRYDQLVKEHGCPMEAARKLAESAANAGGSLASNSVSVTIRSFDPRSCTVEPARKRLPLTMTVKELKLLCQKLFKVDVDLQVLFYRETSKDFGHPQELNEDAMPIVDFGVKAGGEIIMEARDPEKEKADAAKRQAKDAAAMKLQEERAQLESDLKRKEVEQAKSVLHGSS